MMAVLGLCAYCAGFAGMPVDGCCWKEAGGCIGRCMVCVCGVVGPYDEDCADGGLCCACPSAEGVLYDPVCVGWYEIGLIKVFCVELGRCCCAGAVVFW